MYSSLRKLSLAENLFFAVLVLLSMAGLMACGNNSSAGDKAGDAGAPDMSEAQEIIAFNNALIEVDDRNNGYLGQVRDNIDKIVAKMQSPATLNYLDDPTEGPLLHSDADMTKVPSSLKKEDRNFFTANIASMNDLFGQIKTNYKSLYNYMQAEDFKDDGYQKGKQLVATLNELGTKYYAVEGGVIQRLGTIGDAAEREILKDNPLKELIFAMKDDNAAVENMNDLLDSAAANYSAHAAAASVMYGQLSAQYEKHAALAFPSKDGYTNQRLAFSRYYSALNDYLVFVRKLMRDAGERGKISDDDLESLRGRWDTMRIYYNDFVS